MFARSTEIFILVLISTVHARARASEIVIGLLQSQTPKSAVATDPGLKQDFTGVVTDQSVRFPDVPAGASLDIKITTREGPVLQGFDTGWYADVDAPTAAPEPLTDEDTKEITSIVKDIPSFYSRSDLLHLTGSRERAVALVQLIRDTPFHGDAGGEIIWRVELWYFENQAGGWAKVGQSNKVLRRERFKSKADFDRDAGTIRWVAELGGVKVKDGKNATRIVLRQDNDPSRADRPER